MCLSRISKAFQGKPVIRDFSLTIKSSSFMTWLGPSGCGKTTLLRVFAGLEVPMRERSFSSPRRPSAPEAYRFVDDPTISYFPLCEYSSRSLATRFPITNFKHTKKTPPYGRVFSFS
ncbi:MAG TPA: hypothetical protein DCG08_01120, partial [Dialister sp.]|nr:hypothetical protein [Dialister sp.]